MKKMLTVVLALLLSAGLAHAGATVDLNQDQFQGDGGAGFDIPGEFGQAGIAGGWQVAVDGGSATSTPGDTSGHVPSGSFYDQNNSFNVTGGIDTIDVMWGQEQGSSFEGSTTGGGAYGFSGVNAQLGGAAAANNEVGTFSVAGGAQAALSTGIVTGVSSEFTGTWQQQQEVLYSTNNQDTPTGARQQQGGYMYTYTQAGVQLNGSGTASSAAGVLQGGGSLLTNDGQAANMSSQGSSAGEAFATGQDATAYGYQEHIYRQEVVRPDGTASQLQWGGTFTEVQATTP